MASEGAGSGAVGLVVVVAVGSDVGDALIRRLRYLAGDTDLRSSSMSNRGDLTMTDFSLVDDRIWLDLRLTVRILVVTDGAISLWDDATVDPGFTLRNMARALWDAPTSLYPYTRFMVDHASHGTGQMARSTRTAVDPVVNKTRTWTDYTNFRFDGPGFALTDYDQVWFFGKWPGNVNDVVPAGRVPLSANEVAVLATWMDAGGGVFATGDHWVLGQHLCGEVPRVRRMRRWSAADGVPSAQGQDRVDTIVPVTSVNGHPVARFIDQSDDVPKPLQVKRYSLWDGLIVSSPSQLYMSRWAPHPVLCSPWGVIDILPDHMHEGLVREDTDVVVSGTYDVNGTAHVEFPGGGSRPTPEVIAWATVRGGNVQYSDLGSSVVDHRVFPEISVYDGERAGVGRVVVDATWHNWLDINTLGTGSGGATGLQGRHRDLVHSYVRNIAQWLAKSWQRDWMRDSLFVHVVANTGGWTELVGETILLGDMAHDVLGRRASVCTRTGLVFDPWWLTADIRQFLTDKLDRYALPPEDLVHRHVLGAMTEVARELVPTLPRVDRPGGGDRDTVDLLESISRRLASARAVGVARMTAELRAEFDRTLQLLDLIDRAAEASVDRPPIPPDPTRPGRRTRTTKPRADKESAVTTPKTAGASVLPSAPTRTRTRPRREP